MDWTAHMAEIATKQVTSVSDAALTHALGCSDLRKVIQIAQG